MTRTFLLCAILTLTFVGCGGSSADLQMGQKLLKENLDEQALPHFDKALAANPNLVDALVGRAECYLAAWSRKPGKDSEAKAKNDIDAILKLNPKHGDALMLWGFHCVALAEERGFNKQSLAKLQEAESYLQKAIESDPDNMAFRKALQTATDTHRRAKAYFNRPRN